MSLQYMPQCKVHGFSHNGKCGGSFHDFYIIPVKQISVLYFVYSQNCLLLISYGSSRELTAMDFHYLT